MSGGDVKVDARLLLFAKAPEPGEVKTRLIATLGADGAAHLYRTMVRYCLASACDALPGRVELWCSPDTSHPFFGECAERWGVTLRKQGGADLGGRMSDALRETLQAASIALLMGTDVPSIGAEDIRAAVQLLCAGKDAVVLPTEDGGYGLIGLRRHDKHLFSNIDWSTSAVMGQTRARLKALDWNWAEMPVRWDIDDPQDLQRFSDLGSIAALAARSTQ